MNTTIRTLSCATAVSMKRSALSLALLAGVVAPAWAEPAAVTASGCAVMAQALPGSLSLQANFHESIDLPLPVTRLAVAQPEIADVAMVGQRNLLIQGKKPGVTSLLVWTRCSSSPQKVQVNVQSLSAQLTRQAAMDAELPSQVQADIRFVEVSRSRLKEVGSRLMIRSLNRPNFFNSPNAGAATGLPSGVGVRAPGQTGPDAPVFSGITDVFTNGLVGIPTLADSFNILWGGSSDRFMAAINLLEQTGYAYTLSQPSLVTMSGQSASFLAGGEVPIPVPQGQNGNIAIEYKEFGVRLALTPTIISRQKIVLKVAPEVSDLDFSNALTIQNSIIPALRVRRADTTITLADGESFVIGGLISRSTISNADKVPGLGNIPVLGAFFRSNRFESEDRELLMIVTPRLVRPLAQNAQLPALPGEGLREHNPSATSLFFMGDPYLKGSSSTGLSR